MSRTSYISLKELYDRAKTCAAQRHAFESACTAFQAQLVHEQQCNDQQKRHAAFSKPVMQPDDLRKFIQALPQRTHQRHESPERQFGIPCRLIDQCFNTDHFPHHLRMKQAHPTSIDNHDRDEDDQENDDDAASSSDASSNRDTVVHTPSTSISTSLWDYPVDSYDAELLNIDEALVLSKMGTYASEDSWTGEDYYALYSFELTYNPRYDCTILFYVITIVLKKLDIHIHDIEENLNYYFGRNTSSCFSDSGLWTFYASKNDYQFKIIMEDDCDCQPGILMLRNVYHVPTHTRYQQIRVDLFEQNTSKLQLEHAMVLFSLPTFEAFERQVLSNYHLFDQRCVQVLNHDSVWTCQHVRDPSLDGIGSTWFGSEEAPWVTPSTTPTSATTLKINTSEVHKDKINVDAQLMYVNRHFLISHTTLDIHCYMTVDLDKGNVTFTRLFSRQVFDAIPQSRFLNISYPIMHQQTVKLSLDVTQEDSCKKFVDHVRAMVEEGQNNVYTLDQLDALKYCTSALGLWSHDHGNDKFPSLTDMLFGKAHPSSKPTLPMKPLQLVHDVPRSFDGIVFQPIHHQDDPHEGDNSCNNDDNRFSNTMLWRDYKMHVMFFVHLWNEYGYNWDKVHSQRLHQSRMEKNDFKNCMNYYAQAHFTQQWTSIFERVSIRLQLNWQSWDPITLKTLDCALNDSNSILAIQLSLDHRQHYTYLDKNIVKWRSKWVDAEGQPLIYPYDVYTFVFECHDRDKYQMTIVAQHNDINVITENYYRHDNDDNDVRGAIEAKKMHIDHHSIEYTQQGSFATLFAAFIDILTQLNDIMVTS